MMYARTVLLILFLLAGLLSPPEVGAQGAEAARSPPRDAPAFSLEQNYPDPVNSETWIPFNLDTSLFTSREEVSVTMRIYNILNQVIAIPEAAEHPSGRGTRINNLGYADPGRKFAYWDGRDQAGRQVPSGVYYVQLVVDDVPDTRKLVVLNTPRRRRILPW
ncbi:MAG: hypothetical protein LBG44_06675 [Gemmatimonadota bacterium]|jgi:hypothetical protein|nr:hypothetical protein [Gemmatimonadota bacterium]